MQTKITEKKQATVTNLRRTHVSENADVVVALNWYEREGKNLVGEEPVENLSVADTLALFDAPFWNKLYHCWALDNKQIERLQPYVNHHIDTEKYSYFLEMYKINKLTDQ